MAASAGDTGLEPVWVFRMISCLWPTWMGKVFDPLGHHLVRAGIWGRQQFLLAANLHVRTHALLLPNELAWHQQLLNRMTAAWVVEARSHVEGLACATADLVG